MVQQPKEYFLPIHFVVGSPQVLVIKKHRARVQLLATSVRPPQLLGLSCVVMCRHQNIIFGFGENPTLDFVYV